jgi:hypothetical protein
MRPPTAATSASALPSFSEARALARNYDVPGSAGSNYLGGSCSNKPHDHADCESGASRARTGDLLGAIQALSQLSYSPALACPGTPERRKQGYSRRGAHMGAGICRCGQ